MPPFEGYDVRQERCCISSKHAFEKTKLRNYSVMEKYLEKKSKSHRPTSYF
ncbi:hypothetical protein HMPREF6745_1015 [Prevotella sp. oral taxon 472 str. F0295]|jgi:hypothetical protein|nr:hypothetical protein HMPREF6745_1015 [Prevotella sp. oral taxon 472 str. F0295]